jgi:hypothetical protein
MRTEFQRLIDDLEELKSTRLYENSFKAIDDCIYLLYSRKNYFESLEQKTSDKNLDIINFINERKNLLKDDLSGEDSNIWISTYTQGQISELNKVLGFIYCT